MSKLYRLSWVDAEGLSHATLVNDNDKKIIGRSNSASIIINHPSVSRVHAEILRKDGLLAIRDLNSSFGTWVNNVPLIGDQMKTLFDQGEVRLGNLSLWYEVIHEGSGSKSETLMFETGILRKPVLPVVLEELMARILKKAEVFGQAQSKTDFTQFLEQELLGLHKKQESQLREQQILNSISHVLNRSNTLSELSNNALALLSKVLSADRGCLVLYDHRNQEFSLIAHRNFSEQALYLTIGKNSHFSRTLMERCAKSGEHIIIDDVGQDKSVSNLASIVASGAKSLALIPLIQRDEVIGIIYLDSASPACFHARQLAFLNTFSAHTSIALHNVQLYHRAITDDLTQFFNRNYIDERLEQELERAKRYGRPFSILIMDLDHFKSVNDTYGHAMGDQTLKTLSELLRKELRDCDIAGRMGGEEFLVILGETEKEGAAQIAERLRQKIEQTTIIKDHTSIRITASFGLSCFDEKHTHTIGKMIEAADAALYKAKAQGRNQVVVA